MPCMGEQGGGDQRGQCLCREGRVWNNPVVEISPIVKSYSGSSLPKPWRNIRAYAPAKEANRTGRKKIKVNRAPHKDTRSPRRAPADGGLCSSGVLQPCIQQREQSDLFKEGPSGRVHIRINSGLSQCSIL